MNIEKDWKVEVMSRKLSKKIFGERLNNLDDKIQQTICKLALDVVNNNIDIEEIDDWKEEEEEWTENLFMIMFVSVQDVTDIIEHLLKVTKLSVKIALR